MMEFNYHLILHLSLAGEILESLSVFLTSNTKAAYHAGDEHYKASFCHVATYWPWEVMEIKNKRLKMTEEWTCFAFLHVERCFGMLRERRHQ